MIRTGPAPAPWRPPAVLAVGGLTEVGIATLPDGQEYVLVVSHSGRGVVTPDGDVVARDRADQVDDWCDPIMLTAEGIGPLRGKRVPIAGLAGGGLPLGTSDGWGVARYPVDWPDERVILEPPNAGVLWPGHEAGCTELGGGMVHEIRAVGFSPSGRLLLIATTGDLSLYTR